MSTFAPPSPPPPPPPPPAPPLDQSQSLLQAQPSSSGIETHQFEQHDNQLPLLALDAQVTPYGATDDADAVNSTPASPNYPRRASWLAVLILPARVAAAALSFAAGATLSRRAPPHPFAVLSGALSAAASHVLIGAALRHNERRRAAERAQAAVARHERVQWLDAIQAVGKIVDRFSHGLAGPRSLPNVFLDASIARVLHSGILRRRVRIARNRARTRTDVLQAARRFCDFAMATYGFVLLAMLDLVPPGYNPATEGMRAEDVARYMLRIPASDIVLSELEGEAISVPRHFVALDSRSDAVVVAIRGTNSVSDVLTDLICENQPFASGYAHAGMMRAAETLRSALLPTLRSLLAKRPRYGVVVTGHSMGAGVAILLTKLLLAEDDLAFVKCYAFAPCPVFGPMHKVDSEWSDALECFVHADDLVARLCLSSARRLVLEMEQLEQIGLSVDERKAIVNNRSASFVEELLRRQRRGVPRDPREAEVEQLYIPTHRGIHWLVAEEDDADTDEDDELDAAALRSVDSASEEEEDDDVFTRELDRKKRDKARAERRKRAEQFRREIKEQSAGLSAAYIPSKRYGSFIVRPRFFERILVTSGCVSAHFPNSYTAAFAGMSLPPEVDIPLPEPQPNFSTPWYNNELGS